MRDYLAIYLGGNQYTPTPETPDVTLEKVHVEELTKPTEPACGRSFVSFVSSQDVVLEKRPCPFCHSHGALKQQTVKGGLLYFDTVCATCGEVIETSIPGL